MTTHTLYDNNVTAGRSGRLLITACPAAEGFGPAGQWLVQFTRWNIGVKTLDQCAAWMPRLNAWDQTRWRPIGSHLIPADVLADVEAWLRGRPVGEVQDTITTTTEAP
jgi:hypothetical protein